MTPQRKQEIQSKLGNVKMLVIERMSQLMIDRNRKHSDGKFGLATAITADMDGGSISPDAKEAQEWVNTAIEAIRRAPGGDRFGSDEEIAGEILKRIEERRTLNASQARTDA